MERRFIEESFPIKEISKESNSEKSARHGHPSLLHVWWARRPLAASRSTNYASLIPHKKTKLDRERNFIENLSKWKNSLNLEYLEIARKNILKHNNRQRPKILDPFAGGGAIPLESLRLNCETFANDYNPVSTLILKCTIEYPQKFNSSNLKKRQSLLEKSPNRLLEEFDKWQKWVLEQSKNEIGQYYFENEETSKVGSYWAYVIQCQNPSCKLEIPLLKQFWLEKKRKISLLLQTKDNKVEFKIVGEGYEPIPNNHNPLNGTMSDKVVATCPFCSFRHDRKIIHKIFQENNVNEKIISVVLVNKKNRKSFRIATKKDIQDFENIQKLLKEKQSRLHKKWGIDPIPNEPIPEGKGKGAERAFGLRNYNLNDWGNLFNERQLLSIIILIDKVRDAHELMIQEGYEKDQALIITTYLAFIVDRIEAYNCKLCKWVSEGGFVACPFSLSGLSFIFDYFESNPFSGSSGSWESAVDWIKRTILHLSESSQYSATVTNKSATSLPYEDSFFDAVFTDPPYYDNFPYSYLSDFFYVWLKRSIGHLYPELFVTPLTPKSKEIVLYANKEGGWNSGKIFFEDMLSKSFKEIYRVLKNNGTATIVYAHKSTEGWETLIKSLLESGLIVTAAWPIHTERQSRPRSNKSASLASSIYMICKKWKKEPIGFYRDVKKELKQYLNKKLEQLWGEGISGADFFISSIGSAVEVYGKYEKVIDDKDESISIKKLLNDTRTIVTNYAINKVFKGEFSEEISQMTRFYILWRWAYGETKVPFDDALKMAQSVGIDIEHEWNKGFIIKDKEFIRVLSPDERTEKELSDSYDLIDILHNTLQIWKKGKKDAVNKFLEEKGYKNSEVFKRVAQAISESLPIESTEKKWLDGFLTGFKIDGSQGTNQSKLF